jgi:hypothetical protein
MAELRRARFMVPEQAEAYTTQAAAHGSGIMRKLRKQDAD